MSVEFYDENGEIEEEFRESLPIESLLEPEEVYMISKDGAEEIGLSFSDDEPELTDVLIR